MAATTLKRQSADRKDPRARRGDASLAWTQYDNADPTKVYAQVHRDSISIAKYQSLDYEVEVYTKTGVRPKAVRPAQLEKLLGKEMEVRDCVVMSIDKDIYDERKEEAKLYVDALYAKIHNKAAVKKETFGTDIPQELNGDGEPYFDVEDVSRPLKKIVTREERANG